MLRFYFTCLALACLGEAVDLFLNKPVNIQLSAINPSAQINTRSATITDKLVCAVVQFCPLSNIAPITSSSGGSACTVSGSSRGAFDFLYNCVTRAKENICHVDYEGRFQSVPEPMCGSSNGVWLLDSTNTWASYPAIVNFVPGAGQKVDMFIALTPLEEDFHCSEALKKDYCGAVTDVSYLTVSVETSSANEFSYSNLVKLSKKMAGKAVLGAGSFQLVAYSNSLNDQTKGEAVYLVPTSLIQSQFEEWQKSLNGDYPIKSDGSVNAKVSLNALYSELPSKYVDVTTKKLSGGAVAGIVIACIAVVALLAGTAWYRRRKYGRVFGSTAVRL
jgi:hypothetical protein